MMRVGYGYDIHRLVRGRRLVLGGVEVESEVGPDGHSDADVVLHAISDAMLGAAGLGDIGEHFPDTDPRFRDADSGALAEHLVAIVTDRGFRVVNADFTIVTELPKLHAYKEKIRRNVARLLRVDETRVNIKAKTREGLDAVGEGRAMEAHAVVLISREDGAGDGGSQA